ncbi:MAG: hypothetical protein CUN57_04075, partial [Phototrophicales bacterium]
DILPKEAYSGRYVVTKRDDSFIRGSNSKGALDDGDEDGLVSIGYAQLYSTKSGAKRAMKQVSNFVNSDRQLFRRGNPEIPRLTFSVVPVTVYYHHEIKK